VTTSPPSSHSADVVDAVSLDEVREFKKVAAKKT
jgi:hypothetical protein